MRSDPRNSTPMNRLVSQKSPYLLQHAANPVDWYPWGEEAFAAARLADKPIFLSIGYSTCHWCHVMEHESFESDVIAGLLNRDFVSIKVDREERPDVDRVYMLFVQSTTGSGGWPMSVWLTPELKPFFGGTYFPPDSRYGRAGFEDLLSQITRAWRENRLSVVESADAVLRQWRAPESVGSATRVPSPDALLRAVGQYQGVFDPVHGGFGSAPRFPRPSELLFLLRESARTGDEVPRVMAIRTLSAMASGGIRDHLGGGFHRYSVDAAWRVPHFEKMLYDQAQLVLAYLEAFEATGELWLAEVAEDTLRYVDRDLTDALGGFTSAEDADSLPPEGGALAAPAAEAIALAPPKLDPIALAPPKLEPTGLGSPKLEPTGLAPPKLDPTALATPKLEPTGLAPPKLDPTALATPKLEERRSEGAFYLWGHEEFDTLLGADADLVRARFGILPSGNAPSDPQDEFGAKNLLYAAKSPAELARDFGLAPDEVSFRLSRARAILFETRALRPRPHLDDKVITAWNGLMIAACARGARVLGRDQWLTRAVKAAQFLRMRMWSASERTLYRRYRDGEVAVAGFAEDYACAIWGALELAAAGVGGGWLDWALTLQRRQDELFLDAQGGGWFSTTDQDASILLRLKEDYDGAEPSASSIGVTNLLKLARLTGDASWHRRAERILAAFGDHLTTEGRRMPLMLAALSACHASH